MAHPTRQREPERGTDSQIEESSERTCDECGSPTLVMSGDQSELVCEECGLVIDETTIDPGPEWRAFNATERENRSRVGAPTTQRMHEKGLTTSIDWKDTDTYGRALSDRKQKQMHRLRKWQERIRTRDAGERNLQFALGEIDRMASALGIPRSVREVASTIYRRAIAEDLIRGRSIEGIATACLYAACRQNGIPRSLEEVADVSRVERKEIGRAYRYIAEELSLEMEPVDPAEYVPRFCSELDISENVQTKATEIIELTTEKGLLSGKSPPAYAAAAIYAACLLCKEDKTQREVAEVAQVTVVTIRNRSQEQIEAVGLPVG